MSTENTPKIRIAIIGGGIAGASMANGLYKQSHLDVHVYEADSEFSARGAAIGLASNAQDVLNQLIPNASEVVLDKAGATAVNSTRVMAGSGPYAGQIILDLPTTAEGRVVHRAALLNALVSLLPNDILHVNKRLSNIERIGEELEVTFVDGEKARFDAIIGADGIFSTVRKHVHGHSAKQHEATAAGFWDCRCLVPLERAKRALGEDLYNVFRQYGWCGDGAFIMHDVLDNGETAHLVIAGVEKEPEAQRSRPLTREFLQDFLANWMDGPIARNMMELVLECKGLKIYSEWEHKTTPTWANGRICVMGDASHASTPWQGSGVALAIEDAVVLTAVMAEVKTPADVAVAFQAYSETGMERAQRVIDSSKKTGRIMCHQDEAAGQTPEAILEMLKSRWEFIQEVDIKAQSRDAVQRAAELRASK